MNIKLFKPLYWGGGRHTDHITQSNKVVLMW